MRRIHLITAIFLLVGTGLSGGAVVMTAQTMSFVRDAARAEGTVIELVRSRSRSGSGASFTFAPLVRFTTAGGETIEFRSSVSRNPPAYRPGDRVTVLYQPESPHSAEVHGFFALWLVPLILGGIGSVVLLIGGGILLFGLLARRRREHLQRYGVGIEADLQGVERHTSLKVNGRSPFRVITQWQNPATGEIHVFKSDDLWFDPSAYIGDKKKIRVLIARNNPRQYHVDLSFLPQMAR